MKNFAYVTFKGSARILCDNDGCYSDEEKRKMEQKVLDALNESMCYGNVGGIMLEHAVINFNHAEVIDIMNDSNSHDSSLVDGINDAWAEHNEEFIKIVTLLMERDNVECDEKNINGDIHDYLMLVADDEDLNCILSFLRYYN